MTQEVYRQMLDVMKQRRGPYTGIDIPEFYTLMEELFSPREAAVNNVMSRKPATAAEIAADMGEGRAEIEPILETMADKGLCKTFVRDGERCFGCAVCATGCPSNAIAMEAKPDFPTPPKDPKELISALKASYVKAS